MRVPITSLQRTGEYAGGDSAHWDGYAEGGLDARASEADGEEDWEPVDMGGFPTGLSLVGVCLRTVAKDPEIILLHVLSFMFSLSLLILYMVFVLGEVTEATVAEALADPSFYIVLFPYFVIAGAVGVYFRAASTVIATIRLRGGDPSPRDGLVAAGRKIHLLIAWAVVNAVVITVVSLLRRKARGASRLLVDGATLAWGIATYFVIPIIVFEDKGPLEAIDRSTGIVRRTWREALGGNFGIGVVAFLLFLPGFFLFPIGNAIWGVVGGMVLMIAYWTLVQLVFASVGSVLVAALYEIAKTGRRPDGFDGYVDLGEAFSHVRKIEASQGPRTVDSVRDGSLMLVRR
jgi:hypothetical protein